MELDIDARTFDFGCRIVRLSTHLYQLDGPARVLARQLLRSGTSVGANVEEAQAAQTRADFIAKLSISQKELRETRYWLRLLVATELVAADRVHGLQDEAEQLLKIVSTILIHAKQTKA